MTKFVLSMLRDNLLAANHVLTWIRPLLILDSNEERFLLQQNKFESNIRFVTIVCKILLVLKISETHFKFHHLFLFSFSQFSLSLSF
jgi:hypothetical protein